MDSLIERILTKNVECASIDIERKSVQYTYILLPNDVQ